MSFEGTRTYILDRLRSAGWSGDPALDACSYRMIHHFSGGLTGGIHEVCDRLLLYGSAEQKHHLTCFDTLRVVLRLLEERPGTSRTGSFQTCVELLNSSWRATESGVAGATSTEPLTPKAEQHHGSSRLPSGSAIPGADRFAALRKAKTVSVQDSAALQPPAAETPEDRTSDAESADGAAVRDEQAGPGASQHATTGLTRSAGPDRLKGGRGKQHAPRSPRTSEGQPASRVGTAFRAGAVLLLFVALAGALLFVDREQPGRASAELPRPSVADDAPEPDSVSPPEVAALPPARAATPPAGSGAGMAESADTLGAGPPEVEPVLEAGKSAGPVTRAKARAEDPANVAAREDPFTVVQNVEPRLASSHSREERRAEGSGAAEGSTGEIRAQSAGSSQTVASRDVDRAPGVAETGTQQKRIDRLLRDAQRALEEDRLTVPQHNNAYEYYREVLEVAPQHAEARLGMERIAERYIALIEGAVASGRLDRAARYAARGLRVSPGNRKLLDLQQEVQARSLRRALQSRRAVRGGRDDAP